jgi:hypothetical protein
MGAEVATSTLAESLELTDLPEVIPIPVTVASIGPSGPVVPVLVGPSTYLTLPGQRTNVGPVTETLPGVPPRGAGSFSITLDKHSPPGEIGTVIW